ncbi:MAG TPA: biotin/lipoyl-containing protein, partial [Sporichthya sp.]|nr:biotin/lipoyl-containing protein [Sporichthya sp.]
RVLEETSIGGVPTPLGVYRLMVRHPDFAAEPFRVHNRWVENDFAGAVEEEAVDSGSLMVRIGRRVMPVPVPGLDHLGDRAATIRAESAALRTEAGTADTGPAVLAPMQGTVVAVAVKDGDHVDVGDLVAVCEAMKMENPVRAHRSGVISDLAVSVGDGVTHHAVLCTIVEAA